MKRLVSLIIPVINPNKCLPQLLNSISYLINDLFEIIIINQSKSQLSESIINCINPQQIIDYVTEDIISASEAKNLGAKLATSEYLFFLDDDALVHASRKSIDELINVLSSGINDVVIVQRGQIEQGNYITHWPKSIEAINYKNFPRVLIEWNIIIRKTVFCRLGKFESIGIGSNHAALSGEAFILACKIINLKCSIVLFPEIKVSHPDLFLTPKPVKVTLGYRYGSGYAVGYGIKYFRWSWRFYWMIRIIYTSIRDIFGKEDTIVQTIEEVAKLRYRFGLIKCKIQGFIDGYFQRPIRGKLWLAELADPMLTRSIVEKT